MAHSHSADELYSISDLHIGGEAGHQIFNQGALLAALIDHLRSRPPERKVTLVLNGDVIDFLSEGEEADGYLKAAKVAPILERVFADAAFAPIWDALARFVKTENRCLVVTLGNHDVELALPRAHERIYKRLCGADENAKRRIIWSMEGDGFLCSVGAAKVYCTHGNEVDAWNLVDYPQLKEVAKAQEAGETPRAWDPNAGTQLVVDVMNKVKGRFPFVDLLKPETKIVPPMIVALDPSALGLLKSFGSLLYRRARGSWRSGFLAGPEAGIPEGASSDPSAEDAYVRSLLLGSQTVTPSRSPLTDEQILDQMEADFQAGLRPSQVVDKDGQERMLGLGQLLWDSITGRPRAQALRVAIQDWLKDDRTFELTTVDETFERLDQTVDPAYDFVLAGHTHLARAIHRTQGRGFYFNSGTWIRLIRLSEEVLASDESFAPAFRALTAGSLQAIDDSRGIVLLRPTVVRVVAEGSKVVGELTQARMVNGKFTLAPEPKTRFVKARS